MVEDGPREPDEEDSERSSQAADSPTAVWDADALRKAGVADLTETEPAPATMPLPEDASRPTIELEPTLSEPPRYEYRSRSQLPSTTPPTRSPRPGLSWTATIILALVLGLGVYFLVRWLRP